MRVHVYTTYGTVLLDSSKSRFNTNIQHLLRGKSGPVVGWEDAHCFSLAHFAICTQKGPLCDTHHILLDPHSSITFHQEHYHLWNKTSTIGHHEGRVTTKGVLAWTRRANQRQNQRMSHRTKRHQEHRRGREREREHLHRSVIESCKSSGKNV